MPEMLPKPKHLGPEYASQFADPAVVAAYHHRPPYAPGVFLVLRDLIVGEPRTVLDLGCGTGDIARPLAGVVDFVDAVDCSAAMIERGQTLPGGDRPNLSWIRRYAEEVPLPRAIYGLVTAGESLHWMDWARLMPRLDQISRWWNAARRYVRRGSMRCKRSSNATPPIATISRTT